MKNALRSLVGLLLAACGDSGAAGESQVGSTSGSGGTEVGSGTDESLGSSGTGTTVPTGGEDPKVPDMGPSGPPPVDYVIVTTDPLAAAAQRIADYRGETGHVVAVLRVGEIIGAATDPATASEAIRERVRGYHDLRDPERAMFLLLVGDADDSGTVDATTIPTSTYELVLESVPAAQVITTDHRYADLDDDDLPELAVGRLPADSEAAVDAYLAKVKAAEAEAIVGPWNRRINMFAGSYGQGPLVDSLIEKLVNAVLDEISYDFDITMTYASQDSPYVYVPEDFSDQVYARINEGSLLILLEFEGLDSFENDNNVTVRIHFGTGPTDVGNDGLLVPGQSFDIKPGTISAEMRNVRLQNGHMEAGTFETVLPVAILDQRFDLPIFAGRLALDFDGDTGEVTGLLGGGVPTATLINDLVMEIPGGEDLVPIASLTLARLADLEPDDVGGCANLSTAMVIHGVTAFLLPPSDAAD